MDVPEINMNVDVDAAEGNNSPVSTVLLTPTTPESESDSNGVTERMIVSRSDARKWNSFTRSLIANDASVLNNSEMTSRYMTRIVKTLKQYPYSIQYRIITYVLRPDYPPIYSRHSRWQEEDTKQHSYWVACEILDIIGTTHQSYIVEEQINYALAVIRRGSMTQEDLDLIWPHCIQSLSTLRSTAYLWCKTIIAIMLGMNHEDWEGPLRNHMNKNLTDSKMISILRAIHMNHRLTITDDKYLKMFFKWVGFGTDIDTEEEISIPTAFMMTV
jgi:hypothetical protein